MTDWQHYFSQIIQGIATGSIYGLIGLSIVFIYRSTRVINFAQGEMGTSSAYLCYAMLKIVPAWVAVGGALLATFIFGAVLDILIIRRLRTNGLIRAEIITIGLFAVLNSINGWLFGHDQLTFPSPVTDGNVSMGGVLVSYHSLWILSCAIFISTLLYVIFNFTPVGLAFRAISEDRVSARLKGIKVERLISLGWGMSAMIGGSAAMLLAYSNFLYPNLMGPSLLYAFAAAVIGGLTTSYGAIAGGILIGVIENLAGTSPIIGAELKSVVVCAILVLFLLLRPRGLFGSDAPRRI